MMEKMPIDQQNLLIALSKSVTLAERGKFYRFLHQPYRYALAMLYSKCLFPWLGKERKMESEVFFGDKMKVVLPAGTDIFLTHAKSHDSELRLARYLIRYLREGDVFVDAGAHFGYFSLMANQLGCKVVAFEAGTETFKILESNCRERNSLMVHHAALSSRQGELTFYEFPGAYSEFNTTDISPYHHQDWFKKTEYRSTTIQALTLDDYFIDKSDCLPDFIKMDVEGHEWEVLKGAEKILIHYNPVVIMEYHTGKPEGVHVQAVRWMAEKGYKAYIIQADGSLKPCFEPEVVLIPSETDSENLVFMKDR
jgi:FkbM family methyltransferase